MTRDIEVLTQWLQVCLYIAAICATAFPVVWAFSRWWSTLLGRLLMLQAVAFAAALDVTALFQIWTPSMEHILLLFWIQVVVFGLIAASTFLLMMTMIRMNYARRSKNKQKEAALHD